MTSSIWSSSVVADGDRVGQARAATVEQDQAREAREPLEEGGDARLGPQVLDLLQLRRDVDEVDRAVADDLVGDVDVAGAGVACLGGPRR